MIKGTYRPDGSLATVEIGYCELPPEDRQVVVWWVRSHGVDPGRVPVEAVIGYDPATDEWSFPVFVRGPGGRGIRVDPATGDVKMRYLRRRRRTDDFTRIVGGVR